MPILPIPASIRQEEARWPEQIARFRSGALTSLAFKAWRVPMGVYEERQAGHYMVRVRLPAGTMTVDDALALADLAERFGGGRLHLTTRQDVQIHGLDLDHLLEVQQALSAAGLSSRGGGGNTVRNIGCGPRSGVDPDELLDCRPLVVALSTWLLDQPGAFNLPRKFKIAFSGSPAEESFTSVADLGFQAVAAGAERVGFRVLAGGGLGPHPAAGVELAAWVEPSEVFAWAEGVRRVFAREGDRTNRHQARLRYVVRRLGREAFIAACRTEVEAVRRDATVPPPPALSPFPAFQRQGGPLPAALRTGPHLRPERRSGCYSLRLGLHLGDVPVRDLRMVAGLSRKHGDGLLRVGQGQDLWLCGVNGLEVAGVLAVLDHGAIDIPGSGRPRTVTCAGAATCRLGLCRSRGLATAIRQACRQVQLSDQSPELRISGCPNSCGDHLIASIGLQGRAQRVSGRLIPCYEVLLGGGISQGEVVFGRRVGTVAARDLPALLATALAHSDPLAALAASVPAQAPTPSSSDHDWDASEPFTLAGRGPGECGVGVLDLVRVDLEAAERLPPPDQPDPEASRLLADVLLAATRSLLPVFGLDLATPQEVLAAFRERLIRPAWVEAATEDLLNRLNAWLEGRLPSLRTDLPQAQALVARLRALFASLDGSLRFQLPPLAVVATPPTTAPPVRELDLRGVPCPLNFVKAKIALESQPVGSELAMLLDDGQPIRNVSASFVDQGHEVLSSQPMDQAHRLRVRRR